MSNELSKVEFALDDTIGGRALAAETVDLRALTHRQNHADRGPVDWAFRAGRGL